MVGANVEQILAPYGVNALAFSNPDMFLPAPTMYDVVEALGDATGDPYIGVHLGAKLDVFQWSPFVQAAQVSHSVGDLLLRFSIDAYKDANSVEFRLDTRGSRTTFAEVRLTDGGRKPRHNDGFGAALILSILHAAVGDSWEGRSVLVSVCDHGVFPAEYLDVRLARHDTRGFSISFPCEWLLLPPKLGTPAGGVNMPAFDSHTPEAPLSALQHILQANIHDPDLSTGRIADLVGLSKRTLNRRLSDMDTSIKAELDLLRRKQAEAELRNTDFSVAKIGLSVGYPDATVFTRAFKRWTGMTPKQYRNSVE